jgi:hypothetical protein
MPKIAERISGLVDCDWREVYPTGFSIRKDHALLVYTVERYGSQPSFAVRVPLAINADAWEIFHAENEDVIFEHDDKPNHPFRVKSNGKFLGYVMGTSIPDELYAIAETIAKAS